MTDRNAGLKSVYFIYSAHSLLLDDALDRLAADLGGSDGEDLNVRRFAAADTDAEEIVAACQALSFLGGRRLVVVTGILGFNESAQKMLVKYIENPNPQTVLVLTETVAGKQEERKLKAAGAYKACEATPSARVHEYAIKSGLPGWVRATFAARNKVVEYQVIDYLITWMGTDLNRLKSEIEKVCDAAADGEVDLDLVKDLVVARNEAGVFDLVGSVIDRDSEQALTRLSPLLEESGGESRVFNLLERQFQLILGAKTKGRGLSGQKLAAALGVSSGQAFHLEKQSRLFSLESIKRALRLMVEVDFARKSSPIPSRLLLEMLVVDLCEI